MFFLLKFFYASKIIMFYFFFFYFLDIENGFFYVILHVIAIYESIYESYLYKSNRFENETILHNFTLI